MEGLARLSPFSVESLLLKRTEKQKKQQFSRCPKKRFMQISQFCVFLASLESVGFGERRSGKKQTMDLGGDRSIFCNL